MGWIQEDHERLKRLHSLRDELRDLTWMDTSFLGPEEMKIYKEVIDLQLKTAIYWMNRALTAEKIVRAMNKVFLCKRN